MKNLILGAALAVVAACGGGGKPELIDANIDAPMACNPFMQTGCMANEKCTWVVDIDGTATMNEIGHTGCVATTAGDTADGQPCNDAVAGMNGGADTCIKGDLCIARKCKPICDPQSAAGAAAGACATNFACVTYAGVFESAGPASAGVCEPQCDPLSQQLKVGTTGIEACGSADATKPTGSCVFGPDPATWVCAPTGPSLYGKTDRQPPLTDPASMRPFPNGCAPGFVPLFFEDESGARKTVCTGVCAPQMTDSEIVKTKAMANQGDPAALAKLTAETAPKAGNAVCVGGKKGSTVSSPFGEDCRFYWWVLFGPDPAQADPSPYNDTLGFCFAYEKFFDPNTTNPRKSCAELSPPAMAASDTANAAKQGCYTTTAAKAPLTGQQPSQRAIHAEPMFRMSYGAAPLARHVLD